MRCWTVAPIENDSSRLRSENMPCPLIPCEIPNCDALRPLQFRSSHGHPQATHWSWQQTYYCVRHWHDRGIRSPTRSGLLRCPTLVDFQPAPRSTRTRSPAVHFVVDSTTHLRLTPAKRRLCLLCRHHELNNIHRSKVASEVKTSTRIAMNRLILMCLNHTNAAYQSIQRDILANLSHD